MPRRDLFCREKSLMQLTLTLAYTYPWYNPHVRVVNAWPVAWLTLVKNTVMSNLLAQMVFQWVIRGSVVFTTIFSWIVLCCKA